jgi:hypothetical protein
MLNIRSSLQAEHCNLLHCIGGHRSPRTIKVIVHNSVTKFQQSVELKVDPFTQQASAEELLKLLGLSRRFGPGSLEREVDETPVASGTRLVDGATYVWYPPPGQWYLPPGKATRFCRHCFPAALCTQPCCATACLCLCTLVPVHPCPPAVVASCHRLYTNLQTVTESVVTGDAQCWPVMVLTVMQSAVMPGPPSP